MSNLRQEAGPSRRQEAGPSRRQEAGPSRLQVENLGESSLKEELKKLLKPSSSGILSPDELKQGQDGLLNFSRSLDLQRKQYNEKRWDEQDKQILRQKDLGEQRRRDSDRLKELISRLEFPFMHRLRPQWFLRNSLNQDEMFIIFQELVHLMQKRELEEKHQKEQRELEKKHQKEQRDLAKQQQRAVAEGVVYEEPHHGETSPPK